MGRKTPQDRVSLGDTQGHPLRDLHGGAEAPAPDGRPLRPLPSEVVVVPVQAILYLQAMAENGQGDRPKRLGPALPSGYVCYPQ
jgi:hypothetical protein